MPTLYPLLICDKDKFPLQHGEIYYHLTDCLPSQAVRLGPLAEGDTPYFATCYAISRHDFAQLAASNEALLQTLDFVPFRQLITTLNRALANQLGKAMQVLRWRDEHRFCSCCGSRTELPAADSQEYAMHCPACGYHQYPRIQPCTINAIIQHIDNEPHLLLALHQRAKDSGMYTLIAGFVEVGENLEHCVEREIAEEVGLTVTNIRYIASQPWPFPSNLMVGFVVDYVSGDIALDTTELIDAKFFPIAQLGEATGPTIPNPGTIAYDLIHWVKQHYPLPMLPTSAN